MIIYNECLKREQRTLNNYKDAIFSAIDGIEIFINSEKTDKSKEFCRGVIVGMLQIKDTINALERIQIRGGVKK